MGRQRAGRRGVTGLLQGGVSYREVSPTGMGLLYEGSVSCYGGWRSDAQGTSESRRHRVKGGVSQRRGGTLEAPGSHGRRVGWPPFGCRVGWHLQGS